MAWQEVVGAATLMSHKTGLILKRAWAALQGGLAARWRWPGPLPERFVIAPEDIRTADPTRAADIYAGIFAFAGKVMETGGHSPFELEPPSLAFARELHSFSWLRHLRAADGALTRQNARALVADWIAQEAQAPRIAFEPSVIARRILAFVTQSPLILEDAPPSFYRRFLRTLIRQISRLRFSYPEIADGYPRLLALIALTEAMLALDNQSRLLRQLSMRLDQELNRQILVDGGHISRHPGVIIELLSDLLPLRQAFAARGLTPSPPLLGAIDRMMPMLRFFRHADGSFAHFNGMGDTPSDQLAAILAHDDARGRPVANASQSGYQRLETGGTILLMDSGAPPAVALTRHAHAGFLSFEMSSGGHRFIVNCGSVEEEPRWNRVARASAAHSTLVVEDTSAARFISAKGLGTLLISGPQHVEALREDGSEGQRILASHDGYARSFGLRHQRTLLLSADGRQIIGSDRLIPLPNRKKGESRFAIRFHLHPLIRAIRTAGGDIMLVAPNGEAWTFSCPMIAPILAESVFLSSVHGPKHAEQIVIEGRLGVTPEVNWHFTHTGTAERPRTARNRSLLRQEGDLFS